MDRLEPANAIDIPVIVQLSTCRPDLQNPDWRCSVAAYFGVALAKPGIATASHAPKAANKSDATSDKAAPSKASNAETAAERGKEIAQTQCGTCHAFNKGGGTRVGPKLYGVYGTKIAGKLSFSFSAALKKHTGVWDKAGLDGWLKSPSAFAPGTYMTFPAVYPRNSNATTRSHI